MKNAQLFLWLELKQLFTYSPIHIRLLPRGVLGVQNQKGADACMAARIWRMRQKAAGILVDTIFDSIIE
jgi:hypothetical protein